MIPNLLVKNFPRAICCGALEDVNQMKGGVIMKRKNPRSISWEDVNNIKRLDKGVIDYLASLYVKGGILTCDKPLKDRTPEEKLRAAKDEHFWLEKGKPDYAIIDINDRGNWYLKPILAEDYRRIMKKANLLKAALRNLGVEDEAGGKKEG